MSTIRVFYAHAAADDSKVIDKTSKEIREAMRERYTKKQAKKRGEPEKGLRLSIIPGRDDFKINFKGDWGQWTNSIVARKDAITLEPYYHLIVLTSEYVGKATAQIVDAAAVAGRPVFLLHDGSFVRITQVRLDDPEDWQGGFSLHSKQESV